MALFDYVRSEIALPDGWTGELRTQAFGCALSTLLIRADGRLLAQSFEHSDLATVEPPHPGWLGETPPPGSLRSTTVRWRDLEFDGEFEFHSPATVGRSPGGVGRRYTARFGHGRLISIRLWE